MSKTTLEEFIENYLQNKKKENTATGYEDWLKTNGIQSEKIYADSIRDITGDYKRTRSEYGAVAEGLSNIGLTSSGYSDYLSGQAYSNMQKRKAGAISKYAENEAKNRTGYAEYLKERGEKYEKVLAGAQKSGIVNLEDAFSYALAAGLDNESAALLAKTVSDREKKRLRDSALDAIIKNKFNKKQAHEYALSLGLGEDVAKELAEYAYTMNSSAYYSSDYLDYIKDKANSK